MCDSLLTATTDFGNFLEKTESDCESTSSMFTQEHVDDMESKLKTLEAAVAAADAELETVGVFASFKDGTNCSSDITDIMAKFHEHHKALQAPWSAIYDAIR